VARLKEALNHDSFYGVRIEAGRALLSNYTDEALDALLPRRTRRTRGCAGKWLRHSRDFIVRARMIRRCAPWAGKRNPGHPRPAAIPAWALRQTRGARDAAQIPEFGIVSQRTCVRGLGCDAFAG